MSLSVLIHLNLRGDAREALAFYRSVFGGQVMTATYAEFGAPADSPDADRIVWGQVVAENGFRVMAYDVPTAGGVAPATPAPTRREHGVTATGSPFFVALRGESIEEVTGYWEKLADGATVVEQLAPAQWAPAFGMLTDRFGVTWIVDVAAEYQSA